MCERCDLPDHTPDPLVAEVASPVFEAWDRCNVAAGLHGMEISRLETDEHPTGQRWLVWVKRRRSDLPTGTYGAIGMTPQEALQNLASMLEGLPR
jgi:hypothetical protein